MKFKAEKWKHAMDVLYDNMPPTAEIEITVRDENFDQGKICDCVTLVATWSKLPASYDKNRNAINVVQTVEVFPEEENRPARVTTVESRDLRD